MLSLLDGVPILRPVLPDPGVPFQLVHHDDVATRDARGRARPRASPASTTSPGPGELTVSQLAEELGWYSIPVPELAVDAVAEMVSRLGFLPAQAQWIAAFREPVIMSTAQGPHASSAGARATTRSRRCARRSRRRAWTRLIR